MYFSVKRKLLGETVCIKSDGFWISQEKYKRDQEKLQEEWLKAQEDIATSVSGQEVKTIFICVDYGLTPVISPGKC